MPESPEKIITELNRKQELVKRFMPNLLAVYNEPKNKPQVLLFEGKDAVREVYDKILSAKEVNFFATIKDIIAAYPDYPETLTQKTLEKKTKVRELLTRTPENLEFAKNTKRNDYYEQRFTKTGEKFFTDNVLFDDTIVFFSYQPHIFAVMIQSKTIHQSLSTLFELAWTQGEPYEKIVKDRHATADI